MRFLTSIKTAEDLANEKLQAEKQARIRELTKLLEESDFKVLPDYDKPIGDLKEQRQAWRDEIRELED